MVHYKCSSRTCVMISKRWRRCSDSGRSWLYRADKTCLRDVTPHPLFYRWRQGPEDELWLEEPSVLSAEVQLLHLIHSSTLAANLLECSNLWTVLELVWASERKCLLIFIHFRKVKYEISLKQYTDITYIINCANDIKNAWLRF